MNILDLNYDIIVEIAIRVYSPVDLLGQFGFVCKKFASLTKDENLWKGILNSAFTYIDHPSVRDSIALKGKILKKIVKSSL